jgi:hypothetical protein
VSDDRELAFQGPGPEGGLNPGIMADAGSLMSRRMGRELRHSGHDTGLRVSSTRRQEECVRLPVMAFAKRAEPARIRLAGGGSAHSAVEAGESIGITLVGADKRSEGGQVLCLVRGNWWI